MPDKITRPEPHHQLTASGAPEIAAAADLANPRVCPPEEIEALSDRLREAHDRWEAAADAADAASAQADRLFEEEDALEREFVGLVPTTLATLLIFVRLALANVHYNETRNSYLLRRIEEGLELIAGGSAPATGGLPIGAPTVAAEKQVRP